MDTTKLIKSLVSKCYIHGSFTNKAISYHVGSYWVIYIEEKITQYIGGYIGGKVFFILTGIKNGVQN